MAKKTTYLVHFPDGSAKIHHLQHVAKVGEELLPGWILARSNLKERKVASETIQFEVHVVEPPEPQDFTAG